MTRKEAVHDGGYLLLFVALMFLAVVMAQYVADGLVYCGSLFIG